MEAKDTVMSDEAIIKLLDLYHAYEPAMVSRRAVAKAQAEISFKAGIREVVENSLQFIVAHKEVLGDVGEWAECQDVGRFLYIPKAQLKDWGIE